MTTCACRSYEAVLSGGPLSFTFNKKLTSAQLEWLAMTDLDIQRVTLGGGGVDVWAKDVCEALPAQVTTLDCNLTNEKPAFNVRYCVEFNKAVTLLSSFTFLIGTSQLC